MSTTSNVSYFTPFNVGKNESAQRKKESYDASSTWLWSCEFAKLTNYTSKEEKALRGTQ